MACFTAPLAGAAVAAVVQKAAGGKARNPFLRKLHWLVKMALGGSFLLAIEHIYHGEIRLTPPFLTAAKDGPEAMSAMFHEMATVGVSMAALVTVTWGIMVLVSSRLEKRATKTATQKN